jgi:hypothetical protein
MCVGVELAGWMGSLWQRGHRDRLAVDGVLTHVARCVRVLLKLELTEHHHT